MGGLREAVASGQVDERFLEAARRAARSRVCSRPPPTGSPDWSNEDIDDLVFETISRVEPNQIVLAANEAVNDVQFVGWLRKAILTTLNLRARKTPGGRVIRAMDDALRGGPDLFGLRAGHWYLVGDVRQPGWSQGDAELVATAWGVETTTIQASPRATKTAPLAYRRDIRAVCRAVLELAGPLPKAQLAEVVAQRFNVPFIEQFDYLGAGEGIEDQDVDAYEDGDGTDDVDDGIAARWMLDQLTEEERRVLRLALRGDGVRGISSVLGCTKYRAELLTGRLHEKLRRLAHLTGSDPQEATSRLIELVGQEQQLRHSTTEDGSDGE